MRRAVVVAYCSSPLGSTRGGFPDTESWIVNFIMPTVDRWAIYTRCHVGDLKERFGWIPAWWLHLFADRFAHAPKDANGVALAPKWWEMDPKWKEKPFVFGLTLWDAHYTYREVALWAIGGLLIWAGSAIILSVAHVVITIVK